MKRTTSLLTVAVLTAGLSFTSSAWAGQGRDTQPSRAKKTSSKSSAKSKAAAKKEAPKKAAAKKKAKNFDFTGDEIDASRIRPDGTAIFGLEGLSHKSLIRIRSEFIGEIVKSAEML
jgi:hypothetical protein